jgi:hypothetical protein
LDQAGVHVFEDLDAFSQSLPALLRCQHQVPSRS